MVAILAHARQANAGQGILDELSARLQAAGSYRFQTEVEQTIAVVWREVLQVDEVGIHDNFFDLGGNSVQVVQVHNKLCQALDRDVSIIKLFEYPTIHSLAQCTGQEQDRPSSLQQSSDRAGTRKASRQRRRQARQQRH